MDIWLDMIRDNNLFKTAHPAAPEEIDHAEEQLGLTFAADYRKFLLAIGSSICFDHEIKGISEDYNLNVVISTIEAREHFEQLPQSWYVIEDPHIDGILILQREDGSIYQIAPGMTPMKIASNLENYLTAPVGGMGFKVADLELESKSIQKNKLLETDAKRILNKEYDIAREKLRHVDQVELILQTAEKKFEKVPGVGDWLADVPAVISLIRSYIRNEYKEVPLSSIIAGLAAIMYIVSPIDLIPDAIPFVGILDDAAVFVVSWKMIHEDVDKYQKWRKEKGKEF